jgi:hypothetical protein
MQHNQTSTIIVIALCGVLLLSTGFFGTSIYRADVIQSQKFELVDNKGKVRASITIEESGETVLRLRDENGNIRVKLGASKDGSGIVLLNNETNPGIHGLVKENGVELTLYGDDGSKKDLAR